MCVLTRDEALHQRLRPPAPLLLDNLECLLKIWRVNLLKDGISTWNRKILKSYLQLNVWRSLFECVFIVRAIAAKPHSVQIRFVFHAVIRVAKNVLDTPLRMYPERGNNRKERVLDHARMSIEQAIIPSPEKAWRRWRQSEANTD